MKIIKNFIKNKKAFNHIKDLLTSQAIPWYYSPHTSDLNDNFFYCHILYEKGNQSSSLMNDVLFPILGKLNYSYLIRAKINFYVKQPTQIKTGMHVDYDFPHTVALFSLNTNNGYTLFENGTKIKSIENQLVLFDGSLKHCSVNQTDTNQRINININIADEDI